MTTPQPPDPGRRDTPGQPAEGAGAEQPGAQTPRPPADQGPGSAGGSEPTRGPGANAPSEPSPGPGANAPSEPEPAHAGFAAPGTPAGAAGPAGPVGPTGSGGGTRWYRPRRSWPWVTAGVVVGLLLLVLAFGAGRVSGRFADRVAWHERGDWGGHGRMHDGPRGGGPWMMDEHSGGPGGDEGFGQFERGGPGGPGGPGGRGDRGFGGEAVIGTVASVNGPTVVVNVDGGGPVNVVTTDRTRVFGEQRHAVGDLKPGDRVVVRTRDGQPLAVLVPPARAAGTVTALAGDRATLTRPDGMTQVVDLSGVTTKPAQGDRIVARGTIADNGATLKANSVRILPKS